MTTGQPIHLFNAGVPDTTALIDSPLALAAAQLFAAQTLPSWQGAWPPATATRRV